MPPLFQISLPVLLSALPLSAQSIPAEKPHLDKILERRPFTPAETASLDLTGGAGGASDGKVDVRDLVVFLNNRPISASFGTKETLVFYSAGSVTLPVYFSKPVTGTIRLDLGGSATEGAAADFAITYHDVAQRTFTITNAMSLAVPIQFKPWRGVGGEKVIRLTINRDAALLPENGSVSTHILRIRQFAAGEFVGLLSFPPGSGLPSLPVRVGLETNGSALCSFQQTSTLLGSSLAISWNAGQQGFPQFPGSAPILIPAGSLNRPAPEAVHASLSLQRMAAPYSEELTAYLNGFPEDGKPALYHATFTFHDLIRAGLRYYQPTNPQAPNPYAVVHRGRLTLQPVSYAE